MAATSDPAFRLVLVSAWNESGGGFLHRLFDGHPQCYVYPFELQLGTEFVSDRYCDWFRQKYRWPAFTAALPRAPEAIFAAILDEEVKSYLADRASSRFREFDLQLSAVEWREAFSGALASASYSCSDIVAAYVTSLFAAWRNRERSGSESLYLGHCPTIIVDYDRIRCDLPETRVQHVVRSPVSGFCDMKARVPEMNVHRYCLKWSLVNGTAFHYASKYEQQVRIVSFQALLEHRAATLRDLCAWLELEYDGVVEHPSWNGQRLEQMYPFGGVPDISRAHEEQCQQSLSASDVEHILSAMETVRRMLSPELETVA